jgi:hypothetical protein
MRVARLNAAGTGWDKVGQAVNPASPINQSSSRDAFYPDIVGFGGVPHVAWAEEDGTNREIRVARLNADGTEWEMVGAQLSPASPINQSNGALATEPSLASINDSLYVAWNEADGVGAQVRVARLNAAGTAWEKVGQSLNAASPINASPSGTTTEVDLSSFDGIPYVAWTERDAANVAQVRVARLNQAGTGWERIADSASPINDAPTGGAFDPSLASVGGVPFVGWAEDDGDVGQLRVARLEPEFLGQSATAADTTAALSATWHTYGLPYPLGFDYGANLEQSTALTPATVGQDTVTVEHQVGGLTPVSDYSVRPFATAGVPEPRVLGEVGSFTTAPDTTPPETTITKDPPNKLKKSKAKYKFTSNEPNSTFRCKFDKRKFKPCDSGKAKYKRLDDGKHKFKVYAVDPAGNRDPSADKDKFKVR